MIGWGYYFRGKLSGLPLLECIPNRHPLPPTLRNICLP